MKGAYRVIVETRKVKYDFRIKRNITIFTGDSGSGKTVLIDLIREYRRFGSDSGYQFFTELSKQKHIECVSAIQ
ncbi:hypothetical protein [Schaedlerella sp.]|uniref:hypothetical protein n=1 Tax=Schaedlerella sp. TaxID=2676057 RepID=UPI00265FEE37|nr:hypothetical protein [uncultured Schaedlerella sp.]